MKGDRPLTERFIADLGPRGEEVVLSTPLAVLRTLGGGRIPRQLWQEAGRDGGRRKGWREEEGRDGGRRKGGRGAYTCTCDVVNRYTHLQPAWPLARCHRTRHQLALHSSPDLHAPTQVRHSMFI